ncbi:beta-galactosidase [Sinomonas sp. ASV322]|uniref:beta-galactosidase n=1 Tax=Sinomonas sp. ASV322 TaxID=3041920 RepID=UPI0027DE1DEF|nr:beta-galactosidase [Sinomonas sp. ASV322]MDQ4503811.1 beta-galactosidase [Sinomonas sp. ASV322]
MDMNDLTRRLGGGSPRVAFGADYNPEQWPMEVWKHDVELMREAGVNLVSLGIFSWALLEPEEGRYEFGWLDEVMDLLHENGIAVDLANASASPPPWFTVKYPDSAPVSADGVRQTHGSRQAFAACSPDYRRAAAALTTAIAEHYSDHPALAMWHVHNEYGCHNQPDFGPHAERGFRAWLQARYETLDALNDAWGTAFWSQHYYDWSEIMPPRRSGTHVNPSQQLDFARFSSDSLLECFEAEAAIIRAHSDKPVTTNFMGLNMGLHAPIDYWRWAKSMDIVSNDHYLIAEDHRNHQDLALTADLTRGWADNEPWLLMEHSTSAVNWQPRNIAKSPGQMLRNSFQHLARGADGILFFQWRASRAGAEKYHSGMLPHAGRDTKVWREVVELGASLEKVSEAAGSRVVASAALVFDTDARWGAELDSHPSIEAQPVRELREWHDALYRAGITTDLRQSTDDLSAYQLVVAPMLYLVTDDGAANLRRYVEGGGTLVLTHFSGIVDEHDRIIMDPINGGGYPGAFRELLGIEIEEFFPLRAGEAVVLTAGSGARWSELGRTTTAEVISRYEAGPTSGSPAVTRNVAGAGIAYYVGTAPDPAALAALLPQVFADAGLEAAAHASEFPDLEVVTRASGEGSWVFAINHGDAEARLGVNGSELLSGTPTGGALAIPAGGIAVVRLSA